MQRAYTVSRFAAPRHASPAWCRLNTTVAADASPPKRLVLRQPRDAAEARIGYDGGPNSVRLKFFHAPRNSADVLASVQYIEKLCGKIDEFICGPYGNRKGSLLYIRFRDYDSAARALSHSHSHIRIPAPELPKFDPLEGGMTLASLKPFLSVKAFQPELQPVFEEPDSDMKFDHKLSEDREFLYFKVENAYDYRSAPALAKSDYISRRAKRKFVEWAGFAPLEPLPPDTPLLEQGDAVDHPIMRHVVRRYVTMLKNAQNPLEGIPGDNPPKSNELQPGGTFQGGQTWIRDSKAASVTARSTPAVQKSKHVEPVEPVESESSNVVDSPPSVQTLASEAPATTSANMSAAVSPPTSTTPPASVALPPSPSTNSPEALAQLRAANSVLKNIKSKNAKIQAQPSTSATAARPQSTPQKVPRPQKQKVVTQRNNTVTVESPIKTQGETEIETGEGKKSEVKKDATGKLRGFMGNWFS